MNQLQNRTIRGETLTIDEQDTYFLGPDLLL